MVISNTRLHKNSDTAVLLPDGAGDALLEVVRTRRSVRRFKPDPIPEEVLQQIFEAARWAPTNCNKQLWRIVVIDEQQVKESLVREAGASTLILNVPVIMVVTHYNDVYLEAYQSASAAVQNILLMANAKGLGSLWLNSKGNPAKYYDLLGIPEEYVITNLVLLGYPTAPVLPPPRRDADVLFFRNHFTVRDVQKWVHDPGRWNYDSLVEYQRFICCKTELGTSQDVFAEAEGRLVEKLAEKFREPHLDLFSYDGHIARYLPKSLTMTVVDSCEETSGYSQETLKGYTGIQFQTWGKFVDSKAGSFASASLLFRAERLPSEFIHELSDQVMVKLMPGGTFFLVFRNRNIIFLLFYRLLILALGDNLSKTAIYSFFGPYKPCDTGQIKRTLKASGLSVQVSKHYPIPPIFARIAELISQYRLSKGGNFMHTLKHRNALSHMFELINKLQSRYRLPWFGSISIVTAVKPMNAEPQNLLGDIA